jgi:hypothetical protein
MIKYRVLKSKTGQSLSLNGEATTDLITHLQSAVANEVGVYVNFFATQTEDEGKLTIKLKAPSDHPKGKISEFVNYKLTQEGQGLSLSASATESLLIKVIEGQANGVFINMYGKQSKFSDGFLTVGAKKEARKVTLPINAFKEKKKPHGSPKSKTISE